MNYEEAVAKAAAVPGVAYINLPFTDSLENIDNSYWVTTLERAESVAQFIGGKENIMYVNQTLAAEVDDSPIMSEWDGEML